MFWGPPLFLLLYFSAPVNPLWGAPIEILVLVKQVLVKKVLVKKDKLKHTQDHPQHQLGVLLVVLVVREVF